MNREQKLIDIMFEMVLISTDDPIFCNRPRGEKMAWVANQLRGCGFDTEPIGSSWGSLISVESRDKFGSPNTKNLEL